MVRETDLEDMTTEELESLINLAVKIMSIKRFCKGYSDGHEDAVKEQYQRDLFLRNGGADVRETLKDPELIFQGGK